VRRALPVIALSAVALVASAGLARGWLSDPPGTGTAAVTVEHAGGVGVDAVSPTAPLRPGGSTTIAVRVTNTGDGPAIVTRFPARESQAAGDCPAGAATTDERAGPAGITPDQGSADPVIPASGSGMYLLTVRLAADAPPACQSQALPLDIQAVLAPVAG
jgi:hypothetical protein